MSAWRRLSVVVGVVVSACAGAALSRVVIPPAHAGAAQRWEYLCLDAGVLYPDAQTVQQQLNDAGKEGWEFAASAGQNGRFSCLKRPAP